MTETAVRIAVCQCLLVIVAIGVSDPVTPGTDVDIDEPDAILEASRAAVMPRNAPG